MDKPEPLFPTIAACPSCGKRTRLKWQNPKSPARGVERVGVLNCPSCGGSFLRTVGSSEGIAELAQALREEHVRHHQHDHGEPRILSRTERWAYIEVPHH